MYFFLSKVQLQIGVAWGFSKFQTVKTTVKIKTNFWNINQPSKSKPIIKVQFNNWTSNCLSNGLKDLVSEVFQNFKLLNQPSTIEIQTNYWNLNCVKCSKGLGAWCLQNIKLPKGTSINNVSSNFGFLYPIPPPVASVLALKIASKLNFCYPLPPPQRRHRLWMVPNAI